MSRKVLVTGGLGFLGYHLATHLLRRDPSISLTIVDNLSSTKIDHRDLVGRARVLVQDLRTYMAAGETFDDIYHLASPVGSLGILSRTGRIAEEILSLTYVAAELAARSQAKLLFVSSSEVYGRDGIHSEDARLWVNQCGGARTEYALGKMASEVVLRNLSLTQPLRYNVCRPFNAIGEHQSSTLGFAVPAFFEAALHGRDIPVFMPGTQRRSFCHVSDIVEAMVLVQESPIEGEVFNIGNDQNVISISALAERVRDLCGSTSGIVLVNSVAEFGQTYSEAFEKIPDIRKIGELLAWKPRLGLQESLEKVRAFYVRQKAEQSAFLEVGRTFGQSAVWAREGPGA
jgi:nucleoside-diphosphate-sugar epimerase